MAMIRKESRGDYQIGIYSVFLDPAKGSRAAMADKPKPWRATTGFGFERRFRTLGDAYLFLTGEPLRQTTRK